VKLKHFVVMLENDGKRWLPSQAQPFIPGRRADLQEEMEKAARLAGTLAPPEDGDIEHQNSTTNIEHPIIKIR